MKIHSSRQQSSTLRTKTENIRLRNIIVRNYKMICLGITGKIKIGRPE